MSRESLGTVSNLPTAKSFRDLEAWQKAKQLAALVYRFTQTLPESERFGLSLQLRRAAIAVAANIAEGHGRNHDKEKVQFFSVARTSAGEVEAETDVSLELGMGDQELGRAGMAKADEVQRILRKLEQYLRASAVSPARLPTHAVDSRLSTHDS